jgi:hypothetical protein
MRALPLALAAAAATSFLELLPEPSMVCDNSKCLLESEDSCLREYAIDRRCSTFGDAYLVLDDALAACARHENCSGVYDPRCDGMPAESCRKDKCEHNHCWAHNYHREPSCAEGYSPMPNSSHDHDWYPFACCPAGTGGGFFMCDANEALADHPASDLHDTRGCVVTCAAWNVSDCTAPTYVGTVTDRRCEETVRLDKIGAGRYENFGHHSYWHGGNHTMDFMDCVAAVRAHAGQDGCRGEFFYWEDWGGRGGNCRCVTGNCTEARREWDWQLFSLGCPGAAEEDGGICTHTALYYDGSQDLSAHDPDKCREHVCEHHDRDCCGYDHETWCADGYTLVRGNEGPPWGCWPGRKGYRCLPSDAFLGRFVEPYDFEGCPAGYYTCAGCCDQDADCACDGLGGDAYEHDWRTPKCPEGYYECDGCCDRDADCACDDACDLGSHEDCSLAYHENVSQPAGWCPVGYHDCDHHDCCDFNVDCECVRVRHGSGDEYCGPGPTGSDGALPNFECSVRKHGEEASGDEVALEDRWEHHNYDAGGCCAGPNETAACADGYTVVAGDAPCVFTCCEGAVDNLTTAADVDAEGFCWEAHADEGRRPPLVGECCDDETDACPGGEQKVYVKSHPEQGETYETHCCPRASAPAACFERKRRADCVEDACRTSDIRRRRRYRDRLTPTSAQVQARRPGHTG